MINQILGKKKFQLLKNSFLNSKNSCLHFCNFSTLMEKPLFLKKDPFITKTSLTLIRNPGLGIQITKFYKKSKKIQNKLKNFNLAKNTTDFDLLFKKCTNFLMIDPKKTKPSKILFDMLLILKKRLKKENGNKNQKDSPQSKSFYQKNSSIQLNFSLFLLISKALENLVPNLEVRKVRVAGSTYSVPSVLSKKKQETLALKWIIESAKKDKKIQNWIFQLVWLMKF
jgi:ribosomal protein S7